MARRKQILQALADGAKLLAVGLMFAATLALAQGPAYPYSVYLSFAASSGTVTGYNIYRAPFTTLCGTFARLNSIPFTTTSYIDSNPPQGAYCYGATAVDGTAESGLSNIDANIQIPPPPPTGLGATVALVGNKNETTFAWTQSSGKNLTANRIFCKQGTAPMSLLVSTSKPVDKLRIVQASGNYVCEVTVLASTAQSGPSNQVSVAVP